MTSQLLDPTAACAAAAAAVEALHATRPHVQCITNSVVMAQTANGLLALGASPSMSLAHDEVGEFVRGAGALLVNLGTMDAQRQAAIPVALDAAQRNGVPWVLDPVMVHLSAQRLQVAMPLVDQAPTVIRGNALEVAALAGVDDGQAGAWALARRTGAVVACTGRVDLVTDGRSAVLLSGGHAWMDRVTGMGCLASALVAAFLAVADNAPEAAVGALLTLGLAAEDAAARCHGPGSFQWALLDALHGLEAKRLLGRTGCVQIASEP